MDDYEKDMMDVPAPQQESDSGMNTIFPELPTFNVGERTYTLRPLGLNDAVKGLRVFAGGSAGIFRLNAAGQLNTTSGVVLGIMSAIPYAENHVKDLISDILTYQDKGKTVRVKSQELDKTELFPLGSLIDIIEAFGKHPDLGSFLKNVQRLKNSPLMEQIRTTMGAAPENSSSIN